jgi:phospholipase/lecithinase/hemolysin
MRRAVAPLLLALAIVSPLVAQSAATSGPTTRYSRLYVFGDSYSDIGAGTSTATVRQRLRISAG